MSALSAAKEHERCIDPGRRIFAASRTAAFLIAAIFSSMLAYASSAAAISRGCFRASESDAKTTSDAISCDAR